MPTERFRTDRNNNPTAFTTDIAHDAGLVYSIDYTVGDPFMIPDGKGGQTTLHTANLLGDPIITTIKVIDKLGFFNKSGHPRWTYLQMESALWKRLSTPEKVLILRIMYKAEGGSELMTIFKDSLNKAILGL